MTDTALPAAAAPAAPTAVYADLRGQISWALFEFARQPYVSLIYAYVFAPYFANVVVGDPVRGQEYWSFANTIATVIVAFMAPLLGAVADSVGRRKPWILFSILLMAPGCWLLWYAMPGGAGWLTIPLIIAILAMLVIVFDLGAIFHNSMLTSIAPPSEVGRLSGWGLGIGAIGTLIALVVMLFGVALPASGAVDWSFLPDAPLFGLDAATHQHERIAGPVAAVWMVVFILPLLLWTPDRASTNVTPLTAMRDGIAQVWRTLKRVRQVSNVGVFLFARMAYNDAFVAIIAYSGIYAVGMFGWDLAATLLFGFLISIFCVVGGFIGSWLDTRFGSKRAIEIGLWITAFFTLGAISGGADRMFFVIPFDGQTPVWAFPYFRTAPEIMFVFSYAMMATFGTACIANSRAMMAKIAPLSMMSQFFGLFALSGTATAFLGHAMVNIFTNAFDSQRAGMASTLILLAIGMLAMRWVKEERAPELT